MPFEGDEDYDKETLRDILYRIEKLLKKVSSKIIETPKKALSRDQICFEGE